MIGKLLCAVALASAALAQNLSIISPAAGTQVAAGAAMVVQIERPIPATDIEEVAIAIVGAYCLEGCPLSSGLGHFVLYNGQFNPQSTGTGKEYQNFTVTAPNTFNGAMKLHVAHFYLEGLTSVLKQEIVSTPLKLAGSSG